MNTAQATLLQHARQISKIGTPEPHPQGPHATASREPARSTACSTAWAKMAPLGVLPLALDRGPAGRALPLPPLANGATTHVPRTPQTKSRRQKWQRASTTVALVLVVQTLLRSPSMGCLAASSVTQWSFLPLLRKERSHTFVIRFYRSRNKKARVGCSDGGLRSAS